MAYAALDERPRALADGLMLAFRHPVGYPAGTIFNRGHCLWERLSSRDSEVHDP
jgi:hypothetical protein